MKKVAIIGAGITGLRAGLEIIKNPGIHISFWEKSPSVGGRVATRRYGDKFVNHGATDFEGVAQVLNFDGESTRYFRFMEFKNEATELPKAMRDYLLKFNGQVDFRFKSKVLEVKDSGSVLSESGKCLAYDHVLITTPLDQSREILKKNIFPEVVYSKRILFIGVDSSAARIEMNDEFSHKYFESTDKEIYESARRLLGDTILNLEIKRWRYSTVLRGVHESLFHVSPAITLAGDAFDPRGYFRLGGAWLSGLSAGKYIKEKYHGL